MKRLLLIFSLTFILIGCQVSTTVATTDMTTISETTTFGLDYSDFSEYQLTDVTAQLSQEYDTYYLYFYQEICYSCNFIKQEVLAKLELLENDIIFLVELHNSADVNDLIDVDQTPSMVRVVNNQVDEIAVGSVAVLAMIEPLS
ncbi:MAG: hypothetical protein JXB08_01925 [Bacilli bacterium]|nr:hypothetical protein [Bacilli bacterium]MBN2876035.1 hypothetical protein [Bacilli bacterium]